MKTEKREFKIGDTTIVIEVTVPEEAPPEDKHDNGDLQDMLDDYD